MKKIYVVLISLLASIQINAQYSCENALVIDAGVHESVEVTGDPLAVNCFGIQMNSAAIWYLFTPTESMDIQVSSAIDPTPTDTRVFIFQGTCDNLICVAEGDDEGPGYSSIANFSAEAGVTYFIAWDNYWSSDAFTFSVTETVIPVNVIDFTQVNVSGSFAGGCDMNGDGLDDLFGVSGTTVYMALQTATGDFETTSAAANSVSNPPSWSTTAGRLNNDEYADIVCGGGSGVSILLSNSDGTSYQEFTTSNYVFSQRGNCVDINNDGLLDVFMCHDIAPNVRFINNNDGTFDFSQGGLGETPDGGNYGSVWIDYDNDCDIDLFIAKCRGGLSEASRNQLHRNNGDGTFTDVSIESNLADYVQTWSSAWADYDNDGDMDGFIGASSFSTGIHRLMRNNGDGTFTDVIEGSGYDTFQGTSIEWQPGDFNNDGWVDIIGGGNFIGINNGDMTFTISTSEVGAGGIGDYDNDGYLDVATGSGFQKNNSSGKNFIKVHTVGSTSNKDGIGARVTIYTPSGNQIRDIRSGEGFRHMSSMNAHFGLGDETVVSKIEICWPSGIMDEILNPDINTTITVNEGSAVSVSDIEVSSPQIYPNPAKEMLFFTEIEGFLNGRVEIYNLQGQLVLSDTFRGTPVSIEALRSGVYHVKFINGTKIVGETLVKE